MVTVSLCMIVKDEEQFLECCLQSVQGVVDEIVIVDTGSSDRTKEIAARFTSSLFDFGWVDDFAAARNYALSKATSDWILILDADEVLDEQSHTLVREALLNSAVDGYTIITRNYSNHSSQSGWQSLIDPVRFGQNVFYGWSPSQKVRLFRRLPGVLFEGCVHEVVEPSLKRLHLVVQSLPLVVHHYGAVRGSTDKLKSYLALAKKKVAVHQQDPQAYLELGIEYKEAGNLDAARQVFRQGLSFGRSSHLIFNLAVVEEKLGNLVEAKTLFFRLVEEKEFLIEALAGLGYCYFQEGNITEAERYYQKALVLQPAYVESFVNLGAICEKKGEYSRAIGFLQRAIGLNSVHPRAYYNLGVVYENMKRGADALRCYENALRYGYRKREFLQERITILRSAV
ncbi:TPA: tetratricopeptide repeat protein [Candidatus Woesearchaeota archaeon]|nr:tetratricopeptide repeat protein [Candidatus Woesearchaeota archaeon]